MSFTYSILIEIIELILSQKYKEKDNILTGKNIENSSMDIYDQSIFNNEEKKD